METKLDSRIHNEHEPLTKDLRWSTSIAQVPHRYRFLVTDDYNVIYKKKKNYNVDLIDRNEHISYQNAIYSLESSKWLKTMKYEMEYMHENKV